MITRATTILRAVLRKYIGHRTTDSYVIGFPKSGNTWLQVMLGKYVQLLAGRDEALPLPLFDSFDFLGRCTRWHHQVPRIQFTHHPLTWDTQTGSDLTLDNVVFPFRHKAVVLIVRSIPDILVSHYWQYKTRVKPPYNHPISYFIRDPVFGVEKCIRFFRLWDEGKHSVRNIMLLRYEDLRLRPEVTFRHLLEFWSVPVDNRFLETAIGFSGFENMRKLELANLENPSLVYTSSGNPIFATGNITESSEAHHVRKGEIGGYREYLSDSDIQYLAAELQDKIPAWYGYAGGFWK
jgi:hypothetical protein